MISFKIELKKKNFPKVYTVVSRSSLSLSEISLLAFDKIIDLKF